MAFCLLGRGAGAGAGAVSQRACEPGKNAERRCVYTTRRNRIPVSRVFVLCVFICAPLEGEHATRSAFTELKVVMRLRLQPEAQTEIQHYGENGSDIPVGYQI